MIVMDVNINVVRRFIAVPRVADYPRLRFTFRCDLARVINLICIVRVSVDAPNGPFYT